jgi:hypothetical protein
LGNIQDRSSEQEDIDHWEIFHTEAQSKKIWIIGKYSRQKLRAGIYQSLKNIPDSTPLRPYYSRLNKFSDLYKWSVCNAERNIKQ